MIHDDVATRRTPLRFPVLRTARRLVPALGIVLALGAGFARDAGAQDRPAPSPPPQDRQPLGGLERLSDWLTAVGRHEPGKVDEAAIAIGGWSRYELDAALADLTSLLDRASKAVPRVQRSGEPMVIKTASGSITLATARDLLGLTDDEIRRRDPTRIVKRGAVLHADLAVFSSLGLLVDHSRGRSVYLVNDGRQVGSKTRSYHWEVGRTLLDEVEPDPGRDGTVRLWYHAAAAFLILNGQLAELETHVQHARGILPTDAAVQYFNGALHESFSSPQIQSAIRGTRTEIGSEESESKKAERFFRQAVTLDPAFVEARLRLGRALGVLGRHAEASSELQSVPSATGERELQYYANLYLGREEQALGRRDAARAAFERAASLYPRAQSPYLALSQLARRYGDRPGAWEALQPLLGLPARAADREDPWWDYYGSAGRHADALLAELRAPFLAGVKR